MNNAENLLSEGVVDIAAFDFQQFAELYLKYKLIVHAGDYPKTHSLKRLLKELGKIAEKETEIHEFMRERT